MLHYFCTKSGHFCAELQLFVQDTVVAGPATQARPQGSSSASFSSKRRMLQFLILMCKSDKQRFTSLDVTSCEVVVVTW